MYDNVRKPESDWYEAGYSAPRSEASGSGCYDSYWSPSQTAAPKKKSHQGLKITMIILGVLVLIIASCYVFAARGRDSVPSVDPGQHGSVTIPQDDADDDTTVTGKNELPGAPTDPGVTMALQPAGGSVLSLQSVYAKCLPSVVGIHADIRRGEYSTGTGIVLTSDGYIVTNTHVLDGAKSVTVTTSDGTEYTGALVGADAVSDIAVLKIDAQGLTPAEFGDSSSLQVGDDVVSIGNPLGEQLRWTMTNGIISAINRAVEVDGKSMTLLQTNAALNNGNSGGPLINAYGQVIGINTLKMSTTDDTEATVEGLGFALPISSVSFVVNDIIATGSYRGAPSLGITVTTVEKDGGGTQVQVVEVSGGSGAADAGIQAGDVILAADGQPISVTSDLLTVRRSHVIGDTVTLTILRDGQQFDVEVVLRSNRSFG